MHKSTTAAALALTLLAGIAFTGTAYAVDAARAADPVVEAAKAKDPAFAELTHLSQDAHAAMRGVTAARIAMFNGHVERAGTLMTEAKAAFAKADKETPDVKIERTITVDGKVVSQTSDQSRVRLVPFDGEIDLSENFVMTPAKAGHVQRANDHLRKGERRQAVAALRDGEIDVSFARMFVPVELAQKHVDDAIRLAGEHKYYEANLALKAIEDSVTVDTVAFASPGGTAAPATSKPATRPMPGAPTAAPMPPRAN
jgi:hypothetical protein